MASSRMVFVGIKGTAIGMDQGTGTIIWETHLKGNDFVHLLMAGDELYAVTYGEVFCIAAASGEILWHNPLRGYGFGLASIAVQNAGAAIEVSLVAEEISRRAQAPVDINT